MKRLRITDITVGKEHTIVHAHVDLGDYDDPGFMGILNMSLVLKIPDSIANDLMVSQIRERALEFCQVFKWPPPVPYDIYVFCDECSVPHRMGIRIKLADGPTERASIGDVYAGKDLPSEVASLIDNKTTCPKTGKLFLQRDNKQIFIVPVEDC